MIVSLLIYTLTKNVMLPAGMFRRTKWHCPCDSEPQPARQPNMVLFFFIELRWRTSHCSDPNMFCVSSSHKSCKYRQRLTLSKNDLSTKYDKGLQLTSLYFQRINMLNSSFESKYSLKCHDPKMFYGCVSFLVPQLII